jgi:phosphoribosylanthranilate isomerase
MKTKICGLREQKNVMELAGLHPEWMGFIFVESSPRSFYKATEPFDIKMLPKAINKVGVFVNEVIEEVRSIVQQYGLDMVQLHGNESPEYCAMLQSHNLKIIKAFSIDAQFDPLATEAYTPFVDYFLFDTKGLQPGGNGVAFNWNLLRDKRFSKPFLLSGGISANHAEALKQFKHPDCIGIDINSRFESAPGVKDVSLIRSFLQQIQS